MGFDCWIAVGAPQCSGYLMTKTCIFCLFVLYCVLLYCLGMFVGCFRNDSVRDSTPIFNKKYKSPQTGNTTLRCQFSSFAWLVVFLYALKHLVLKDKMCRKKKVNSLDKTIVLKNSRTEMVHQELLKEKFLVSSQSLLLITTTFLLNIYRGYWISAYIGFTGYSSY